MRQGGTEQLEGPTFDLPSSSTGRMWEEETEKERMCERQPDEPLLGRGGGLGRLGVLGAPSVPPDMLECPVLEDKIPLGQDDARGGASQRDGATEWGPRGWASVGRCALYLCALSSAASACQTTSF